MHLKTCQMKSGKLSILRIKQKKLLKRVQQFNKFNKVIKQNGYYIYVYYPKT